MAKRKKKPQPQSKPLKKALDILTTTSLPNAGDLAAVPEDNFDELILSRDIRLKSLNRHMPKGDGIHSRIEDFGQVTDELFDAIVDLQDEIIERIRALEKKA